MTRNDDVASNLVSEIDSYLEEEGVYSFFELYDDLYSEVKMIHELNDKLEKEINKQIFLAYAKNTPDDSMDVKQTVEKKFTIKDGSVYEYGSTNEASPSHIVRNIDAFDHIDDLKETIEKAEDVSSQKLIEALKTEDDEERHKVRVLMDDDRKFDAVSLKAKTNYSGNPKVSLKLIEIGGSNEKMQPREDMIDKHVEELVKFLRYGDEMTEVTEVLMERVTEQVEIRKSLINDLRDQGGD